MTSALIGLVACLTWGQTSQPYQQKDLPKDWPPLPNFKEPVDYVKWFEDRLNAHVTDDARPLYDEITKHKDDPEEIKKAKAKRWGENERGIPGLITGIGITHDRYAWDPVEHPDWEEAYQAQISSGLHKQLVEISRHKHLSQNIIGWIPEDDTPTQSKKGKDQDEPSDLGLTSDDYLIMTALLPSMAPQRHIARVILQNAWRAPNGKVNPNNMSKAISSSLRIANQIETSTNIGHLVNISIRDLTYDTAIRSLEEGVLDQQHINNICMLLRRVDNMDIRFGKSEATSVANLFDLLQFCYLRNSQTQSGSPAPNYENVNKLQKCIVAEYKYTQKITPSLSVPPLDLVGQINQCDPETAVRQIVGLFLEIRKINKTELPQIAGKISNSLIKEFKNNPANHVIIRQYIWESYSRLIILASRAEATRRATHLLYLLHRERERTGKWPESLDELQRVPRLLRKDPFSVRDFGYRVKNNKMFLYSAGMNGSDDGGKHNRQWGEDHKEEKTLDADYVFWPVPRAKN